jgi:hypothetical protein
MKIKFTPVESFYDPEDEIFVEEIGAEIITPDGTREVQMRFEDYVCVRADVVEYGEWIVYDLVNDGWDAALFFKDYGEIYDEAKEMIEQSRNK